MSTLLDKLELYAKHNLNVLLIGTHGIGKSTVTKAIADKAGLKFKYYSASTLDPFADLVGIPVPDREKGTMAFYRPKDLEEAEFLMFDELNRAHPRVLNAVMEIIQFKSVNGTPLPNLKMVWAAINPPGDDYQVEELDPALVDRFHQFIKMDASINLEYLETKTTPEIAKALHGWWNGQLSAEQKRVCTPRRIEYIGMMLMKQIPIQDAFPQGHIFPVDDLHRRIRLATGQEVDLECDPKTLIGKQGEWIAKLKEHPRYAIPVSEQMKKFTDDQIFQARDLLETLPKELVIGVGGAKFVMLKRQVLKKFVDAGFSEKEYPKIFQAFGSTTSATPNP